MWATVVFFCSPFLTVKHGASFGLCSPPIWDRSLGVLDVRSRRLWALEEGGYRSEVIIFPIEKALLKGNEHLWLLFCPVLKEKSARTNGTIVQFWRAEDIRGRLMSLLFQLVQQVIQPSGVCPGVGFQVAANPAAPCCTAGLLFLLLFPQISYRLCWGWVQWP